MTTNTPKPTEYLKPLEAAQYLRSSPSTLAKLRVYAGGPTYSRIGRAVRYRFADLDAWMDLRTPGGALSSVARTDPSNLAVQLAKRIADCKKCTLRKIKHDDAKAIQARRNAECLMIRGNSYIKSHVLKAWFPKKDDRAAMKSAGLFSIGSRDDTPTIEKKIVGIKGKPRYYLINDAALERLSSSPLRTTC